MTEKPSGDIRVSLELSPWRAITLSLGVMLLLLLFVLGGETVAAVGAVAPLAFLLAVLLLLANVLGYVELAMATRRPGGAYVLVHEAQGGGWLAFVTGWALALSGLGLCALLSQGFGSQVTTLLYDHLGLSLPAWPWAAGLVVLSAANNVLGTQESHRSTMLIVLLAAVLGLTLVAAPQINPDHYVMTTRPDWGRALPLLFVAFVGLEITAGLQGEIRRRTANAPRALLLAPLLAALVGAVIIAVAIGVVGTGSLAASPVPLALFGEKVFGGGGRPVVLVVGMLALAVAFNRALMMVVRQLYVMSGDGFWPRGLRRIQPRFGTPGRLTGLVALLVVLLALVPGAFLARLGGLLYLVVLMAVNLTLVRRKQPESASFALPFHPWIPGLTLAIDVLLILSCGVTCPAWAAGCLAVGTLIYLLYARAHHVEAKEGVTVFKPRPAERPQVEYRVLVPIANPATAGALLRLAGVLARQQGGEVLALQVVTVPEQVPLEEGRRRAATGRLLLERALTQAGEEEFAIQTMTRVAHSVAQGILDTAREEKVDLVLLGWRGYTRSLGASMGPVIDAVMRDAPCDVTIAKGREWKTVGKILVPTAGGPHAPIAARLALLLSEVYGSEVTVLYVQLGQATPERMEENRRRIARTLHGLEFSRPPEQKVVIADSIVEGIVQEAERYDLVLLGASEEGLFDQFVFGSIPQQIAARVPKTAVITRRYVGPTELWTRKLVRGLFRLFPRLDVEEQLEMREAMTSGARPGANFFVLITLSCIIATLGLLLDSGAVVIGAMLVAPLMTPILAFSLGMVLGEVRLIRLSIEAVFKGVASAIIIAAFIGLFSPLKDLTGEIMARTQPTLLDLAVALASGMAGAYALARKDVSAALPGVAIAAALMPPLGVVGLGLSLGNAQVAGGAFLLFVTNLASISLAGMLVFMLLGVRPQTWQPGMRRRIRRGLIGGVLLLLVIAVPLAVIMTGIIRTTREQHAIREILEVEVSAQEGELVSFEYRAGQAESLVVATVRSIHILDQETVDTAAAALSQRLDRPVTLEIITLPVTRSQGER